MAASNASTKNSGTAKAKRSHWSVRELVTLAIFSALGMATLTVALMYGPAAGIMVQLVSWIPKLIMSPLGSLLTFVAMIGAVLIVGLIYKKFHNLKGAIVAIVVGSVVFTAIAIAMNFVITPIYTPGVTVEAVASMVVPILLPFNIIKCVINGVVTSLLYKPVSNLVKMRDSRAHA